MRISNKIIISSLIIIFFIFQACSSFKKDPDAQLKSKINSWLKTDDKARELFRVVVTSDGYYVGQMRFHNTIKRQPDEGGDKYICEEIKRFDMIDETYEGAFNVDLYPDLPGRILKIRPSQLFGVMDIQKLMTDDVQRFNFDFPGKSVSPTKFEIRYRVYLRKKMSDEEIIKYIQNRQRDGH